MSEPDRLAQMKREIAALRVVAQAQVKTAAGLKDQIDALKIQLQQMQCHVNALETDLNSIYVQTFTPEAQSKGSE